MEPFNHEEMINYLISDLLRIRNSVENMIVEARTGAASQVSEEKISSSLRFLRFQVGEICLSLHLLQFDLDDRNLSTLAETGRNLGHQIDRDISNIIIQRYRVQIQHGSIPSSSRLIGASEIIGSRQWSHARVYILILGSESTLYAQKASSNSHEERKGLEPSECAICLDPFLVSQTILTAPCHPKHKFHDGCIQGVVRALMDQIQGESAHEQVVRERTPLRCPICRFDLGMWALEPTR